MAEAPQTNTRRLAQAAALSLAHKAKMITTAKIMPSISSYVIVNGGDAGSATVYSMYRFPLGWLLRSCDVMPDNLAAPTHARAAPIWSIVELSHARRAGPGRFGLAVAWFIGGLVHWLVGSLAHWLALPLAG